MLIRIILVLLTLQSLAFAEVPTTSYTTIEEKATLPLLTAGFAERKTAKIVLSNGLQAYIVSDPHVETSGVAVTVGAGCWSDPTDTPGLAHYLEHMLFLGTEKYPDEAEFRLFEKEHNGMMNAYTARDCTCYMLSINNNAFPEALDRFSQFFKTPLFHPSGVARELNAIDQEHAKNLIDDNRRFFKVLTELAHPAHPFRGFSTGNKATLSNVSHQTLRDWYESHYSANLMYLVVYSALPIDTLKNLVVENFQGVTNRNLQSFRTDAPLSTQKAKDPLSVLIRLKIFVR